MHRRALLLAILALTTNALAHQWEYLVIKHDQTSAALEHATGARVQLISACSVTVDGDTSALQLDLDTLGRHGWELAAVIGAPGAQQQIVFKRPLSTERSESTPASTTACFYEQIK